MREYTPKEFSDLWRVHINTVYRWIRMGLLPGTKKIKCANLYRIPICSAPPRIYPGPKPGRRIGRETQLLSQLDTPSPEDSPQEAVSQEYLMP